MPLRPWRLTADDVVCSPARSADPKRLAFSSDFADFEKVETVDKYTVRISLQHFRGKPKLEKVVCRSILSDASRDLAFTSGEIDLTFGKQDQTRAERIKRVRQAIAYAIDRSQIVQFKGKDMARPAQSIVPIGYLVQRADVPLLPYDREKAKALNPRRRAVGRICRATSARTSKKSLSLRRRA